MKEKIGITGKGFAILEHANGKKEIIKLKNIVTTNGDRYYATKGAGETAYFTVAGARLGTNAATPGKGDNDVGTFLAGSGKTIKAGYPKTSDADTDNTGGGVSVVTWCIEYGSAEGNGVDIAEVAMVDNITTPTKALAHAKFAAAFTKVSGDNLKVFINHTILGS